MHDWEDEPAYKFGRRMYEKLYNQQKDISKNQTHVWILEYILQRFPVVNTPRFQPQNPAPRESITKDGEGNQWPYCMDLHPRSSFGSRGYTEIHMGDLINCFYQCKQMPGLGCVAFIAEEKESEDEDECACMGVRNGQSPKLGGLLVDEILFHCSRARHPS